MIDLMLQNSRIPTGGREHAWLSALIEAFDTDGAGARNHGGESGQAEAAFVESDVSIVPESDLGIDDHMERHGVAIFLGEFFGW